MKDFIMTTLLGLFRFSVFIIGISILITGLIGMVDIMHYGLGSISSYIGLILLIIISVVFLHSLGDM